MFFLCRICSHHFVLVAVTTYNQRHCNAAASGSSIPQIRMGVNCFVTHQRFVKILMASWCRHYYTKKRLYINCKEITVTCYSEGQKSSPDKNFSPGFVSNVTCEIFAYQWNKKLRECITIMFFVSFLENFWSIQV